MASAAATPPVDEGPIGRRGRLAATAAKAAKKKKKKQRPAVVAAVAAPDPPPAVAATATAVAAGLRWGGGADGAPAATVAVAVAPAATRQRRRPPPPATAGGAAVKVCTGRSCRRDGDSAGVLAAFRAAAAGTGVAVRGCGCLGFCTGTGTAVQTGGSWHPSVRVADVGGVLAAMGGGG